MQMRTGWRSVQQKRLAKAITEQHPTRAHVSAILVRDQDILYYIFDPRSAGLFVAPLTEQRIRDGPLGQGARRSLFGASGDR